MREFLTTGEKSKRKGHNFCNLMTVIIILSMSNLLSTQRTLKCFDVHADVLK